MFKLRLIDSTASCILTNANKCNNQLETLWYNIMISSTPVFVLTPCIYMLSLEAANAKFHRLLFDQPGLEQYIAILYLLLFLEARSFKERCKSKDWNRNNVTDFIFVCLNSLNWLHFLSPDCNRWYLVSPGCNWFYFISLGL